MNWWGKILGGTFGMMIGGPLGALLGVILGHNFDKGTSTTVNYQADLDKQERIQTLFYTATFSVMGHLCKADGRVSEDEISLAKQVMRQMELDGQQKKAAIELFNEGKKPSFPLDNVIKQFKQEIGFRPNLIRIFIEIQIMAAFADGVMHREEQRLLIRISRLLNISKHEFDHLCKMIGGMHGSTSGSGQHGTPTLKQAYAVLDIKESASVNEIKKAYRRLLNQHHPDKLVAKGLPEEMMKVAAERTHEIRKAYETIKKKKGF
ncbi:MAG: co-chaperone DjlA [Proteobacteria bacterium]|nr:co-chaperone DjlA [Pseudomonadota bacterium]